MSSKPSERPQSQRDPNAHRGDAAAARRFVEEFALLFTNAGWQRMPSRVFAALLATQKKGLTATEIAEALQVSPAAVSGAVRYLVQVGFVQKVREPGERRDHYLVGEDWFETISRKDAIYQQLADSLDRGIDAVGGQTPAGKRLIEMRDFFLFIVKEFPLMIDRWCERRQAESGAE